MLAVDDIRKKLITQRRELFREEAMTEEDLRWLQSDIESEVEERAQEETMVRLLDCLDGRAKAEIEAVDRALLSWGLNSMVDLSDAERPSRSPGWMWSSRPSCAWPANRRRRPRRR